MPGGGLMRGGKMQRRIFLREITGLGLALRFF